MSIRVPRPVVGRIVRAVVAPILSPRVPVPAQRRLLDLAGRTVPAPPGVRRTTATLGGVPTARFVAPGAAGPHVVLFLHGGGYVTGSPGSHGALAGHLSRAAGAPVHLLHYRRAPEHPYPAAIDDALAAYRALRAAGHPAQRIAVVGDSAGGGLALALLLRLRAAGEELPASVGLVSPWLDLDLTAPAVAANARRDAMLDPRWLAGSARAYRADAPADTPELIPLRADLAGLPPLHVIAGAHEVLVGDADALVDRARAAGVPVTYRRAPRMWHDYPIFAGLLAEADAAVAELGAALRRDCAARRPRVAVVGAGFGGIGMGIALRGAGHRDAADLTILDRADGVGGVWRDNTYPGAACDVPSHLYSFSFAPGHEWSRRFAPQPDILRYLRRVSTEGGLDGHLRLGTEVTEARYDAGTAAWQLSTADGDVLEADVLVSACGQLSRPAVPALPGLDRFAGPVFHSARWDHDVDLTGKRVAVIGTGASAVQFVPAIADRVGAVTVFQRSAAYLIPKPDRRYRAWHHALFRRVPAWRNAARVGWAAFFEVGALGLTTVQTAAAPFRYAFEALLRRQVPDAALREKLRPDYPIGCKRLLISSEYLRALARPDVDVVTDPIAEVTANGVRTQDGVEHPADVIIFGTGFATNDFLAPMKVFGPDGKELSERWRDGARAYLGITVPEFPNLFLLYGPNTNVGSGSVVHMLESQIHYVLQAVHRLSTGTRSLTVRPEAASAFDSEMQRRLSGSVWTGCTSWYRTASGRIVNNWPGLMREYRKRTSRFEPGDYLEER
ncbi:alpha/beta hydrolase fold domain-containing protein [Pseudonocardia sp. H11422]|uniref:alpha/beta hydrolase fold domain-containing protein n=1 Tax=Pseudonocardia sp. H11422 TaxID=2835866 RepID=UPI001BDD2EE3|nr:alpha/beta hydrolase fold domain-containing protein [Pseudonocardia sp. H11422]